MASLISFPYPVAICSKMLCIPSSIEIHCDANLFCETDTCSRQVSPIATLRLPYTLAQMLGSLTYILLGMLQELAIATCSCCIMTRDQRLRLCCLQLSTPSSDLDNHPYAHYHIFIACANNLQATKKFLGLFEVHNFDA